jgi:hypothetical protein
MTNNILRVFSFVFTVEKQPESSESGTYLNLIVQALFFTLQTSLKGGFNTKCSQCDS